MPAEGTLITKKEFNKYAEKRGIKEPHKMPTDDLINALSRQDIKLKSYRIRRKINRLNLKKIGKKTKCFKKRLT